jgi:HK97 gp10 family phage protein
MAKITANLVKKGSGLKKQIGRIKAIENSSLRVGLLGNKKALRGKGDKLTNAQVAIHNEFGTSTARARPFLRPTVAKGSKAYAEFLGEGMKKAIAGEKAFTETLGLLGQRVSADVKNYITQGSNLRPNEDSTIARKGSSRPLIDTGRMMNSITYEVKAGK